MTNEEATKTLLTFPTLRQYYAAQAMAAMVARSFDVFTPIDEIVERSFMTADAMIKAEASKEAKVVGDAS